MFTVHMYYRSSKEKPESTKYTGAPYKEPAIFQELDDMNRLSVTSEMQVKTNLGAIENAESEDEINTVL